MNFRRLTSTAAVLGASIAFAACGSSAAPHTATMPSRTPAVTHSGVPLVPADQIKPSLESSRVPEGAKGAVRDHTQFLTPGLHGGIEGDPGPLANPATLFGLSGSNIHIDEAGLTLIEDFEEVQKERYCPYWDAYGRVYTRGFGETDWSGNFGGRCISHATAVSNLKFFVESKYQYAVRGLGIPLNQCQVDGLDSFVWNLGPGIFSGPLGSAMRRHEWSAILAYNRAGGVVLSGLARRRGVEFSKLSGPCRESHPKTPAQIRADRVKLLHREYHYLPHVLAYLGAHHCRASSRPPRWIPVGHKHHQRIKCNAVESHGQHANHEIARLRKLGIR